MRKVLFQVSISALLLGWFAAAVDWAAIFGAFKEIHIALYLVSTLAATSGPVIMAGKYKLLIARTRLDLPFPSLVAINFIARFYALFVPSSLGPMAVRWYKVTKNKDGKTFFLAATMVERIFFILLLVACGSAPLVFISEPAIDPISARLWPIVAALNAGLALVLAYFLWPALQQKVKGVLAKILNLSPESRVQGFLDNFSLQNASPDVVGVLFLYTVLWQLSFLFRIYLLFLSLDLPFGFWAAAWMGSLVMLLQIIPVSFAGLGLREGAYAFLFSLQGIPGELGGLVGLLFFSQMLVLCLIGWVFELRGKNSGPNAVNAGG